MVYPVYAGIEVSLNGSTWYKLTDHNRGPIDISPEIIQKENRMANGTLRKYVVAKKDVISVSWNFVPGKSDCIVDGNYGGSWLTAFYNANCFVPIYLRVIRAGHLDPAVGSAPTDSSYKSAQGTYSTQGTQGTQYIGYKQYRVFMTDFSSSIVNRTRVTDYLDISIEFTEI